LHFRVKIEVKLWNASDLRQKTARNFGLERLPAFYKSGFLASFHYIIRQSHPRYFSRLDAKVCAMGSVSVIVPCYNYGRFLRECVESILSQPVGVRVLIIDDASTDDTPRVAAELAARDHRVQVRSHPVNRGHIATYNEGLEWISEDYTLLISADDLLAPGALLRACKLMDAHPEVGFVYGRLIRWRTDQPRPVLQPSSEEFEWVIMSGHEYIETVCKKGPPTISPEVVVRTQLQRELGGYCHELPHWADVEMLMRFAAHAPVGYINEFQAYYRIHECNMNLRYPWRSIQELEQRRTAFRALFDHHGRRIENAEQLRALVHYRLAEVAFWEAHRAFDRDEVETCKAYLEFAVETDPEIVLWKSYSRLRWKFAIGPKVWALVRPIWDRISHLIPLSAHLLLFRLLIKPVFRASRTEYLRITDSLRDRVS
ncbi:MAG: glycosyltransferase family 2 protein, partial [Solirubrobacterales bacterium]